MVRPHVLKLSLRYKFHHYNASFPHVLDSNQEDTWKENFKQLPVEG